PARGTGATSAPAGGRWRMVAVRAGGGRLCRRPGAAGADRPDGKAEAKDDGQCAMAALAGGGAWAGDRPVDGARLAWQFALAGARRADRGAAGLAPADAAAVPAHGGRAGARRRAAAHGRGAAARLVDRVALGGAGVRLVAALSPSRAARLAAAARARPAGGARRGAGARLPVQPGFLAAVAAPVARARPS